MVYDYVYVAKYGDLHKIGFSNTPYRRLKGLNPPIKAPLNQFYIITTNQGRALESYFHVLFQSSRYENDWYILHDIDFMVLLSLKVGMKFRFNSTWGRQVGCKIFGVLIHTKLSIP